MALIADGTQHVFLYGGNSRGLPMLDTWISSGLTDPWTKLAVAPPTVFDDMAAAYDNERDGVIIFGGQTYPDGSPSNGLWTFSFGQEVWTPPPPPPNGAAPSPRLLVSAAYDYEYDRVLIQGGGDDPAEIWQWSVGENVWTKLLPPPGSQRPTGPGAFAYDPSYSIGVFFGGATGNELWQWSGTTGEWTREPPTPVWPPPRTLGALVYDSDHDVMLLFGGKAFPSGPALNDLWAWFPNTGWRLVDDGKSGPAPSPRFLSGVTYVRSSSRLMVFGGNGDGTELDDWWAYLSLP
jgi:hypothetical protein